MLCVADSMHRQRTFCDWASTTVATRLLLSCTRDSQSADWLAGSRGLQLRHLGRMHLCERMDWRRTSRLAIRVRAKCKVKERTGNAGKGVSGSGPPHLAAFRRPPCFTLSVHCEKSCALKERRIMSVSYCFKILYFLSSFQNSRPKRSV